MPTSTAMRAVFCALSVLTFSARAQISVTSTDILGLLGKSQVFRSDTTGSIPVNVGAAGAGQIWDFRTQTINGENLTIHYSLHKTRHSHRNSHRQTSRRVSTTPASSRAHTIPIPLSA